MYKLSQLSETSFPSGHIVSRDAQRPLTWSQFLADVASTREALAGAEDGAWALFEKDSYKFAVGLFALLAMGKQVFLPGENHDGVVAALRHEARYFLGEFRGCDAAPVLTDQAVEGRSAPYSQSFSLTGSIVVFTSGSSGAAKPIPKSIEQLDAELAALEKRWGNELGESLVAGTVSHQHFYGLLFALLWPLCGGRCFWRQPFMDPVVLAETVSSFNAVAWVMSPAHLHRIGASMPWADARSKTTAVFSSGGPLEQRGAQSIYDGLGRFPYEILGSSETGGIAWRQQIDLTTTWSPIAGVDIDVVDGALAVRSGWLENDNWYITSDLATLDERGGFILGVRIDRIVKVEGKRVSLPEVELALRSSVFIDQAAAVVLQRRRQSVAAVLVLTDKGLEALATSGRQAFTQALRAELSERLSAVSIPRFWRILEELPYNPQGKILTKVILGMFSVTNLPPLANRQDIPGGCRLLFRVPSESVYFDGHFPSEPVLAGAVQVLWAQQFAADLLDLEGDFHAMQSLKFKKLVFPLEELTLSLQYDRQSGRLDFNYDSSRGRHSQGTVLYR